MDRQYMNHKIDYQTVDEICIGIYGQECPKDLFEIIKKILKHLNVESKEKTLEIISDVFETNKQELKKCGYCPFTPDTKCKVCGGTAEIVLEKYIPTEIPTDEELWEDPEFRKAWYEVGGKALY